MTCYFRHLNEVFDKAGIKVEKEKRQKIDKIIHSILGLEYKTPCPVVWKEIKKRIADNKDAFIKELKNTSQLLE